MSRVSRQPGNGRKAVDAIKLAVELRDPLLVGYFEQFEEPERSARVLEALKVGVIALQTACPTLDTQIVKDQFAELQNEFGEALASYFADEDGILPKSLEEIFGDKGALSQFFKRYFDPESGRIVRLMDGQIGPNSDFGRLFDTKNKHGVITVIEEKVKKIVEAKLAEVLDQFSLDEDDSAMSRLKKLIDSALADLRKAVNVKAAREEEAERGHVKGFDFENDLYQIVAELGRQFGDETEFVGGKSGTLRSKIGDHLITLGETTGAPGQRLVMEVKDQTYSSKKAIRELREAKKNREAVSGIFVFAAGCEPVEFGNFKRVGNDFFCTVDKETLAEDGPLPYLWAAYELARVQAVAAVRSDEAGKLDMQQIQQHIDGIASWVPRLAEIVTKANTVEKNGKLIAGTATEIKEDIEKRVEEVLAMLRRNAD